MLFETALAFEAANEESGKRVTALYFTQHNAAMVQCMQELELWHAH